MICVFFNGRLGIMATALRFIPAVLPKPIEIFRERVCLPCGQYDLYCLRQSKLPQSIVLDFSTSSGIFRYARLVQYIWKFRPCQERQLSDPFPGWSLTPGSWSLVGLRQGRAARIMTSSACFDCDFGRADFLIIFLI